VGDSLIGSIVSGGVFTRITGVELSIGGASDSFEVQPHKTTMISRQLPKSGFFKIFSS
jgi:hypothetical protein